MKKNVLYWVLGILLAIGAGFLGNTMLQSNVFIGDSEYYYVDAGLYEGGEVTTDDGLNLIAKKGLTLSSDGKLHNGKIKVDVKLRIPESADQAKISGVGGILTYNPTDLTASSVAESLREGTAVVLDDDVTTVVKDANGNETGAIFFVAYGENEQVFASNHTMFTAELEVKGDPSRFEVGFEAVRLVSFADDDTSTSFYLEEGVGTTIDRHLFITKDEERVESSTLTSAEGRRVIEVFFDGEGNQLRTVTSYYNTDNVLILRVITFPDGTEQREVFSEGEGGVTVLPDESLVSTGTLMLESEDKVLAVSIGTGALLKDASVTLRKIPLTGSIEPKGFTNISEGYELIGLNISNNQEFTNTLKSMLFEMRLSVLNRLLSQAYKAESTNVYFLSRKDNTWKKVKDVNSGTNEELSSVALGFETYSLGVYALGQLSSDVDDQVDQSNIEQFFADLDQVLAGESEQEDTNLRSSSCEPALEFKDIEGHWGQDYIEDARLLCIIGGKRAGFFEPNANITRAELTKIVVNAFDIPMTDLTESFSDVESDAWYTEFIADAKAATIIDGYRDGTFRPNQSINRAEALKIIAEAGVSIKRNEPKRLDDAYSLWRTRNPVFTYVFFPDVLIGEWFDKYVYFGAEELNLTGYESDRGREFRPGASITRAEAVKIIMEMRKDL